MSDVSLCSRHLSCSDLRPDCERMNEQALMMDGQAFDPAAVLAEGLGPPLDLECSQRSMSNATSFYMHWIPFRVSEETGVLEGPQRNADMLEHVP